MNDIIEQSDQKLLHVYNRFQIVLDHGEGAYLYDDNQKKYLDFESGIAVFSLGYSNDRVKNALKNQINKLTHISNLYYSKPCMEAAQKLTQASEMDRVFFTNSGAEAIEGLIKTARKYAFTKDGSTDHEIIAMNHSFHGRSMGALSVTGNAHYRAPFEPLIGNIRFADFNDLDSVKALVNKKTCAILLETVQGEGGLYPATKEFLQGVRKICSENDILLMLDEIQCGMGRTGSMFAWQDYGVKPDAMAVAKAIGNGVPVGAFLMTEKVADNSMVPGDHGTTYGGNPLVSAAVSEVLDVFKEDKIVEHVAGLTPYFEEKLNELVDEFECIKERRGKGFMQGLECTVPVSPIILEAQKEGLLIISAGANIIRLVPPLIIEKNHIDELVQILRKVFKQNECK